MDEFDEKLFWSNIDELTTDFHDIVFTNYRVLFERYQKGENVNILDY